MAEWSIFNIIFFTKFIYSKNFLKRLVRVNHSIKFLEKKNKRLFPDHQKWHIFLFELVTMKSVNLTVQYSVKVDNV